MAARWPSAQLHLDRSHHPFHEVRFPVLHVRDEADQQVIARHEGRGERLHDAAGGGSRPADGVPWRRALHRLSPVDVILPRLARVELHDEHLVRLAGGRRHLEGVCAGRDRLVEREHHVAEHDRVVGGRRNCRRRRGGRGRCRRHRQRAGHAPHVVGHAAGHVENAEYRVVARLEVERCDRLLAWIGHVGTAHVPRPGRHRALCVERRHQIGNGLAAIEAYDQGVMQPRPIVHEVERGDAGRNLRRGVEREVAGAYGHRRRSLGCGCGRLLRLTAGQDQTERESVGELAHGPLSETDHSRLRGNPATKPIYRFPVRLPEVGDALCPRRGNPDTRLASDPHTLNRDSVCSHDVRSALIFAEALMSARSRLLYALVCAAAALALAPGVAAAQAADSMSPAAISAGRDV